MIIQHHTPDREQPIRWRGDNPGAKPVEVVPENAVQWAVQCSTAEGPAEVAKLVLKFVLVFLGQGRQYRSEMTRSRDLSGWAWAWAWTWNALVLWLRETGTIQSRCQPPATKKRR